MTESTKVQDGRISAAAEPRLMIESSFMVIECLTRADLQITLRKPSSSIFQANQVVIDAMLIE